MEFDKSIFMTEKLDLYTLSDIKLLKFVQNRRKLQLERICADLTGPLLNFRKLVRIKNFSAPMP